MVLRILRTSGNSCTDVRDDRLYWAAGTAQLDAQHRMVRQMVQVDHGTVPYDVRGHCPLCAFHGDDVHGDHDVRGDRDGRGLHDVRGDRDVLGDRDIHGVRDVRRDRDVREDRGVRGDHDDRGGRGDHGDHGGRGGDGGRDAL
jgi:hypothetical protein